MPPKRRRMLFAGIGLVLLASASALVLTAFRENLVFFFSPSDLAAKPADPDRRIRIGGLVEAGSVEKAGDGLSVRFRVTDMKAALPVVYRGALPDLFREGQGVIAEGRLVGGVFQASNVLAKHDENYMPPEVADALKRSGHWKEGEGK